jgi:hypothetical protein
MFTVYITTTLLKMINSECSYEPRKAIWYQSREDVHEFKMFREKENKKMRMRMKSRETNK